MPSNQPGPLFLTEDGKGLTRQAFSFSLDRLFKTLQLQPHNYNTHSFCIGAATTAAQASIPDRCIQVLGCWQSDAYKQYIRMKPQELAQLSRQLVTPSGAPQSEANLPSWHYRTDDLPITPCIYIEVLLRPPPPQLFRMYVMLLLYFTIAICVFTGDCSPFQILWVRGLRCLRSPSLWPALEEFGRQGAG